MLHMLDTDTASYLIKDKSGAIASRLESLLPTDVCISAVTLTELQYGLKRIPPSHRLHLVVHQFCKIIRILPWDKDAAN